MKSRCNRKVSQDDKRNYGYRNITVCEKWKSFPEFYKWAKNKWKPSLVIDRIDTTNNYYPGNCRFVTQKQSQQNRTDSMFWFICGKRFESANDAAIFWGLTQATIHQMCRGRLRNGHWFPPEQLCYAVKKYA